MTPSTQPCACTLEAAALEDRLEAWRRVTAEAVSRTVEDHRVVATYPKDNRLLNDLRHLVDTEAECCSFLEFGIEEGPDRIVTELRLPEDIPADLRALILDLVGGTEVGGTEVGGTEVGGTEVGGTETVAGGRATGRPHREGPR